MIFGCFHSYNEQHKKKLRVVDARSSNSMVMTLLGFPFGLPQSVAGSGSNSMDGRKALYLKTRCQRLSSVSDLAVQPPNLKNSPTCPLRPGFPVRAGSSMAQDLPLVPLRFTELPIICGMSLPTHQSFGWDRPHSNHDKGGN